MFLVSVPGGLSPGGFVKVVRRARCTTRASSSRVDWAAIEWTLNNHDPPHVIIAVTAFQPVAFVGHPCGRKTVPSRRLRAYCTHSSLGDLTAKQMLADLVRYVGVQELPRRLTSISSAMSPHHFGWEFWLIAPNHLSPNSQGVLFYYNFI